MRPTTIRCIIAAAGATTTTSHAVLLDITGAATINDVSNADGLPNDLSDVSAGDTLDFAVRWNTATDNEFPIDPVTSGYQNAAAGVYGIDNNLGEPLFDGDFADATLSITDAFPDVPRGVVADNDIVGLTFPDDLEGDVVNYSFELTGDAALFDSQDIPVGITRDDFESGDFTFASDFSSGTGTIDEFAITLVPAPGAATLIGLGAIATARRSRG